MSYRNHNEAITHIAMPERKTPILIPWGEQGSSGNFFAADWPTDEEADKKLFGFVLMVDDRYLTQYVDSPKAFEKIHGRVQEADAKRIRFLLELADSVSLRNRKLAVKAIKHAFGEQRSFAALRVWCDPIMWLTGVFNAAISNGRPLVWYSNIAKRMTQGTFAKDSATALSLLALARIGDPGAFGTCKRCQNLFFRIRPSKRYCTPRCQSADAMARFRHPQKNARAKRQRPATARA